VTKYLDPSFSVAVGSEAYRDGWDRIFGSKAEPKPLAFKVEEVVHIGADEYKCCQTCGILYRTNIPNPQCPTCLKGSEP
jgi:rubrerythrin